LDILKIGTEVIYVQRMKMKAIAVTPGEKDLARLIDAPMPEIEKNEALLKVCEVGIDGTDIEINQGLYGNCPGGCDYLIVGHECLARVEKAGDSVTGFEKGDLVVPTVRRPDDCPNCRAGESDMCIKGEFKEQGIKGLHGFASEYTSTDSEFLVKVPEELRSIAVLLEPLSIAEKAVVQSYKIQERMYWNPKNALVLGAGPLGILATLVLRLRGLEVTALATRPKESLKAKLISEVGGSYVSAKENPLNTWDRKFDIIIETTGNTSVAAESLGLLNTNSILCFLGVYPPGEACSNFSGVLKEMVLENKTIFGSVNANISYFRRGIEDLKGIQERFPGVLERIVTKRLTPERYKDAFEPDRENIKTVIVFNEE
jgi:threonine dehydrogenase-like Zn-dependent dehydrogenase